MQLVSLEDRDLCIPLGTPQSPAVLGRHGKTRIKSVYVSRRHAEAWMSPDGRALLRALKRVVIVRSSDSIRGGGTTATLGPAAEPYEVSPRDTIFLEVLAGGLLKCGFEVVATHSSQAQPDSHPSSSQMPLAKVRQQSQVEAAVTSLRAPAPLNLPVVPEQATATPAAGGKGTASPAAAARKRAAIPAAAGQDREKLATDGKGTGAPQDKRRWLELPLHAAGADSAAPPLKRTRNPTPTLQQQDIWPQEPQLLGRHQSACTDTTGAAATAAPAAAAATGGLFSGLEVCWWARAHVKTTAALVRRAGAREVPKAGLSTSHIVVRSSTMTHQAAVSRLEAERRAASSRVERRAASTPKRQPLQRMEAAPLQLPGSSGGTFPADRAPESMDVGALEAGVSPAVCFVTPEYWSACLARRRCLPEEPYQTRFRMQGGDGEEARREGRPGGEEGRPEGKGQLTYMAAITSASARQGSSTEASVVPNPSPVPAPVLAPVPVPVPVHGRSLGPYPPPDPSQVCRGVDDWGVDGRWIEPWDDELAKETLRILSEVWNPERKAREHFLHPESRDATASSATASQTARSEAPQQDGGGNPSRVPTAATAATAAMAGGSPAAGTSGPTAAAAAAAVVGGSSWDPSIRTPVCGHAACSTQSYCFVGELDRVASSYLSSAVDQFKKKAINKAISLVEALEEPLRAPEDVDRLLWKLGDKTREKLRDILQGGGTYWRNELRAGDSRLSTLALFSSVWGAGPAASEAWYARGCRSLPDVAALPDLTTMQAVGVKRFHEFQRRIPRDEIAEAERLVRAAFLKVLLRETGELESALSLRLHCRAAGSYLRGKQDCSDMDFLLAPPPAAVAAASRAPASVRRRQRQRLAVQGRGSLPERSDEAAALDPRGPMEAEGMAPSSGRSDDNSLGSDGPPGSDEDLLEPHRLLEALLELLHEQGLVVRGEGTGQRDALTHKARSSSIAPEGLAGRQGSHAVYMGVWRGPSSPCARRIDIKVYPLPALPFALNYFSSSAGFSRAIRHYCKAGVARYSKCEAGKPVRYIHLADTHMVMVQQVGQAQAVVPAGPCLTARWETDIFEALGLHYVPPHMRELIR